VHLHLQRCWRRDSPRPVVDQRPGLWAIGQSMRALGGWRGNRVAKATGQVILCVELSYFFFSRVQCSGFLLFLCCLRPRFTKQTGKCRAKFSNKLQRSPKSVAGVYQGHSIYFKINLLDWVGWKTCKLIMCQCPFGLDVR
jgi:hypothetical protein